MTDRYTDLFIEQDDEGVFDFVVDAGTRDLKTTDGLESAIVVSLFSDRRAYADEVRESIKRRGWIGDLVSLVPNDRHGSGLWLYEQRRMTSDVVLGVKDEAINSLTWMQDEELARYVTAEFFAMPETRTVSLVVHLHHSSGDVTSRAYVLADATRRGLLARL